jgi:hypothetical protein
MPRFIVLTLLMLAGTAFAGLPRAAGETEPPPGQGNSAPVADDARYSFHRVGEGFVRLDSRTGQVSQCGWGTLGWFCKLVADERVALESEIARLQHDNAELKKSLLSRGIELPAGVVAEAPAAGPVPPAPVPDPSIKLPTDPKQPSDAELDRAFAFMKQVWRRLVDMMTDLQRDIQKKG